MFIVGQSTTPVRRDMRHVLLRRVLDSERELTDITILGARFYKSFLHGSGLRENADYLTISKR